MRQQKRKDLRRHAHPLHLRRLGIDTYKEAVIYIRADSPICSSEGFEAPARVRVSISERSIIATLNIITSDLLEPGKAGLSEHAWQLLSAKEGDEIVVSHPKLLRSLEYLRRKIYGEELSAEQIDTLVYDITAGRLSDIHISSFITTCAGDRLTLKEIEYLTISMVNVGDKLSWPGKIVVDKHCIGGLAGNRTTPIIVPIVAEFGLTMPKTSSRAITSPSGTADTMEVLAPVDLNITQLLKVVARENACIAWGGAVSLSPADDILIRVEKVLNLDSEGQLVASVLSKKIAAGSTHCIIDIPVGPLAKIPTADAAESLKVAFETVGRNLGLEVKVVLTDGSSPVGRGVGPALEARDIVKVLQGDDEELTDLRDRALLLAGIILEFSPEVNEGQGLALATEILDSGKAWKKFEDICAAQGGMRQIPIAPYTHQIFAEKTGRVKSIDNNRIALLAKLAGAPRDKVAGVDIHAPVGSLVPKGEPIFTIHAASPGELDYALSYLEQENDILLIS